MNTLSYGNIASKLLLSTKIGTTALAFVMAFLILALSLLPTSTNGAPEDGTIVSGSAAIGALNAGDLSVDQHSDKVIIDWRSFSIEADETVTFSQPSMDSLAVNRVIGEDPSDIFGTLTANGRVMLINPNGVLFGVDSRVDVHSLIATTIDISNQRIAAGDFTFDELRDPSAIIINRGHITAAEGGLVALVAPGVENAGVIEARLGTVTLGAATAFTIDLYGDGLVRFPVGAEVFQELYDRNGQPLTALVDNSGRITVDGGKVRLSARAARGVVDKVINMDGIIEARTVAEVNGEIVLLGGDNGIVEVAGTLDASGIGNKQTGGSIKVLGEKVGIVDGAIIDASGHSGGGEILIGGNFQGKGPEQNAAVTFVAQEASLFADAIDSGDGGTVIVWSDGATRFYGAISAKGGANSGNGGFAEVSGYDYLDYQGLANLTAPFGSVGELLLDPNNITINVAGTEANTTGAPDYTTTNDAAILRTGTIETQLATAAVTVTTASAGTNLEAGNITVDDTITAPATAFGLTLDALANVTINAAIDMSAGTGGLSLLADGNLTVGADLTTNGTAIVLTADDDASGAGTFTLNAGTTVNSGGANITITGDDMVLTATGAITGAAAIVTLLPTAAGTIDLGTGGTGALNLTDGELDLITAGTLRIGDATAGAITLSSAITPALTSTLRLHSGGAITDGTGSIAVANLRVTGAATTLDNAVNDVDVLAISGAGNGTFVDSDDITIGTVDGAAGMTGQRATLTATGDITIDDNITGDRGVVITNNGVDATTFVNAAIRLTASSNRIIDITTDDLEINTGTGSFGTNQTSGTHTLNIKTLTAAQDIDLGAANTASNGIMELTNAELARLNLGSQSLDVINIGDAASTGTITISDSISNFSGNNRTIQNNADVVQTAATTIGTLIIDAATGITLNNAANDITGTLTTSTNTGNITIVDANDLTVGVTTATAGNVDLSADDGIAVNGNVTAGGTLVLEGDADNAADTNDDIAFAAGITATSTGTMTLDATTGGISGAGALTLTSADGVVINDDITTVGALTIEGDSDNAVDTRDDIAFLAGATMTSTGTMTLDATTGGIAGAGALTLTSDDGVAVNDDITTAGALSIEGDADNAADTNDDIAFAAGTTATSTGTMTLDATTGDISGAGALTLTSDDGVVVNDDITTVGALTIEGDADNATDTRDDIAFLAGATMTSTGTMTLDATTGGIGGAGALTLTSDDGVVINDDITAAAALTIEGDADNAVDTRDDIAFLAGATMTSTGTMTLDATTGGIGGAGALTLTSDDGVVVNDDITTVGALTIEGDADNAADTNDDIAFAAGITATSTGTMTLDATTGAISGAGALTLTSADGVVINEDITTMGSLTIEGDSDNAVDTRDDITFAAGTTATATGTMTLDATTGGIAGAGALTLTSDDGVVVNDDITTVGALTIDGDADNAADTRDDIAFLAGATMTSTGTMTLDATTGGIAGAGALTLTSDDGVVVNDDITTVGALTIEGDADNAADTNDDIAFAAGITATSTGTMTLDATTGGIGGAGALTLTSDDGVVINDDITAAAALTIEGDADNAVDTRDDIAFLAGATMTSTGTMTLDATTGGIGGAGALTLTSDDGVVVNDDITTVGALTIEGDADNAADTNDDIAFAAGITATSTGTMTLNATTGGISGAGALIISADDGVVINDDITTVGALTIEGDADNAADTRDDIAFLAGATMTSTGTMTLDATTGGIAGAGALTLTSDDGIVINNDITAAGALTIEGDADNAADTNDDIAFAAGVTATSTGAMTLDATTGGIAGAGALTLTSDDGVVVNDDITTAGALSIEGDADNAADTNDDIAFAAGTTATSTGTMTLDATTGDISGAGALTLNSDDGVVINDDITTVGALSIEGDADNAADARDDIAFAAGATMTSGGAMTLDATTGAIAGAGALSLLSDAGLTINDDLTAAGTTTLNADTDDDGAGNFTLAAGATVNSTANAITVTGADMVIDSTAAITGAGAIVSLLASNGGTIDLGGTGGAMDLSDAELDTVTAGTLRIGDATAGAITISGAINPANATTLRLLSGSTVSQTASVTVNSLAVSGGGAITLTNASNEVTNLAVTTTTGNLAYTDATGFTVGSIDGIDGARTNAGSVALTATAGDITISNTAQPDDIKATTTVDITAGGDESTLALATSADIQATGGATTLTADKMVIDGTVTATGQTVTLAPETAIDGDAIDIGSLTDLAADTLELSDAELDKITATTIVVGSGASGALDVSAHLNTLNTGTLHLISGGDVTQTGTITEASLAVDAGGAVTLTNLGNGVTNLAIAAAGNVAYTDATGFTVSAVDGIDGVSTTAGSVTLSSVNGDVTIANTAAANDVFATTTIDITAGDDESLLAISAGADIESTGDATTLTADNMDIAGTITATGQTVTLTPESATGIDSIDLGSFSDAVGDTLGLSDTELDRVTASAIQIGDANSNSINISATITPAGTNTMRLDSAGSLTDNLGTGIVVTNLAVKAANAIAIDGGATDVDTVALEGNNIIFSDVDGFAIGTVQSLVGLTSAGNVSLSSADGLDITQDLTVVGNLSIEGDSDNAADTRDDLVISAGVTLSAGGTITLDATTGDISGAGDLTLSADDGVVINDDITTVGALTIEGDADNAADTRDDIAFLAGATMTSGGTMTLDATTGGIAGAGALTLTSDDGVVINDALSAAGALTIEGDADNAADTRDDIAFLAGASLTLSGTLTLDATTGGIGGAGALTLTSDDGVVINDDITTVGDLTIEGDADNAADTNDDIAFGAGVIVTAGGTTTLDATTGAISGAGALTLSSDDGVVINDDITTVGALTIEGDADNAIDTRDDIAFLAGATMTSGGLMTLDATTGDIAGAGALTLDATAGITLNDDLTTAGATTIDTDSDDNGTGNFTLATTKTLNTGGNTLSITANDIDLLGSLNSGAASTTLLVSDTGTIGLGATAGNYTLSGAELQRITATGLTIGDNTNGNITVNGITAANSNNITGTVTLNATLDEADVTFATAPSTFNAVTVNADDAIFVNTDITTDTGNLALIADFDNTDDTGPDQIQFGTGTITLATAGALTLQAVTGGITAAGTLVFNVDNGFTLGGDLTLAGALTIDADADNDGTGIFTVNTGINLSTTNNLLSIIASDIAINGTGTISSGTAATSITRSTAGTIGLGATAGNMTITGAELQQITASGLTLGDSNITAITVDGITAVNSNTVGTVTLNATSNTGTITFANTASTFDALSANANDVLAVNVDITADTGNLALDGDADNTDDAGADNLTFTAGRTLTAIGTITLDATTGGIAGAGALTLTSDDGVVINDDITTVGALTIEGDADNAADTRDDIAFGAGVTATSTGTMTLDATTGKIAGAGALTLTSDDGVVINDNITTGGALTIEGDADNAADTRDDIAFSAGTVATSTGTMTLDATTGGIAGAGALTLTSDDGVVLNDTLSAAGALSIDGDADNAADTRDDIAFLAGASITLANTLTLDATTGGINGAGALSLTSDDGIVINANITAAGALTIEGDADNAADTRDDIAFAAGVTATSTAAITLDATTGAISGAGGIIIRADNGITLNDNLTTAGTTNIDADNNNSGAGDFTIVAGKALSTTGNTLTITANDVDLQGTINSGAANTNIRVSDGGPIDIGQVGAGMSISGAELANITATGLTIGDATSGNITVNGITGVQSDGIAGTVTLNAIKDNAKISFVTAPSTFNALNARADDGVTVDVDLTTDVGNMALDGDFDNAADATDKISFTGTRTLTSAGGITLNATTGGIMGTGALTLAADNGITLNDSLSVTGAFTADADADNAADGSDMLSLFADLTSGAAITLDATTGGMTLGANITVTAGGIITLNDPLDGLFDLTIDAGANDIVLGGAIGAVAALDALILDGTALTGDVHSASLEISGDSAVLTGVINGLTGEAAAAETNLTGTIGAGPYTMNGFDIVNATPPPPPPDPTPEPAPEPTPDPTPDPTPPEDVTSDEETTAVVVGFPPLYSDDISFTDEDLAFTEYEVADAEETARDLEDASAPTEGAPSQADTQDEPEETEALRDLEAPEDAEAIEEESSPAAVVCTGNEGEETTETDCAQIAQ